MNFHDAFVMTVAGRATTADATIAVIDPATGEVAGHAPDCSLQQLDQAVAAARAAFPLWRQRPPGERADILRAAAAAIGQHVSGLARLLTQEQGKPLAAAEAEIGGAAYWLNAIADREIPLEILEDSPIRKVEVRRVPLGVVGAIAPWNFPIMLAIWKVAPALLAGNTVVLKPSPLTPLTTLKLGEILAAILPPGILNVVSGGDALGPAMTAHPDIDKISFTGSTATGRRVMASAAVTLKRVTLELGGNDAAIVLPDVDVADVAPKLFWSAFINSGQTCVATKRLYVHDAIYDRFIAALIEVARSVKMGNGLDQGSQLGPIQNLQQYRRVVDLIEDSRAQGHRFLIGGEVGNGPGYFIPVTLIDNPPENSRIVQEEQFGPVLPIMRFTAVDDVIALANAGDYGLAGSVWSGNADVAEELATRLTVGTAWVNEAQHLSPDIPFGGRKQSGMGVENGVDGLLEFTAIQTMIKRLA